MKTYDHIIRFAILIIVVIIGFFIIRAYMVPDTFGVHGSYSYAYYRADSKIEQAALPAVHTGEEHCANCHAPQAAAQDEGVHAALDCESCHGSFKAHNNNTGGIMAISDTVDACMICHETLKARPAEFPQIDSFAAHLRDLEESLQPGMRCIDCHDPHMPM